jgi:hypothetical protein
MNGRGGSDLNSEPFSIPHSKLEPLNLRLYLNHFDEQKKYAKTISQHRRSLKPKILLALINFLIST